MPKKSDPDGYLIWIVLAILVLLALLSALIGLAKDPNSIWYMRPEGGLLWMYLA